MNARHIIEAATKRCTQDGYTSFPALCALLEGELHKACNELNVLQGKGQSPARGCGHHTSHLGAAEVLVEYEAEAASGDGWNEPRYEASVTQCRVFLNGVWCDAEDVASAETIQRWTEEIFQSWEDDKAAYEESRAEARRDDAMMAAAGY